MGAPLVTTVIPTFRRPETLARCIRSVLEQSQPDLVVRVYDDDSGDETEMVVGDIAAQDARVRYVRHPRRLGSAANFNYGLRQVQTPFFHFLSDDDYLLPDFHQHALGL